MTRTRSPRLLRLAGPALLGFAAAVALAGCGNKLKTGDVVGKVTIKGKTPNVEGLAINFLGVDGRPASAPVAADGTYRASGVTEGSNKIGFSMSTGEDQDAKIKSLKPDGKEVDKEQMAALVKAQEEFLKASATSKNIPANFLDPYKSNLTTSVTPGQENTFNVDIK